MKCLIATEDLNLDSEIYSDCDKDEYCDARIITCLVQWISQLTKSNKEYLFSNTLTADIGSNTYMLDEEDSWWSFEFPTKIWINVQHYCDGVDHIYYSADM